MNEYKNIKQLGHCPICGSTEFIVLAKVTGIYLMYIVYQG